MGERRWQRARRWQCLVVLLGVTWLLAPPALAQDAGGPLPDQPSVVIVLDGSGSMRAEVEDGISRMEAARTAVRRLVEDLPQNINVGLRTYGTSAPNRTADREAGCSDTRLAAPVVPLDRDAIAEAVADVRARGWTPIGLALQQAELDLPDSGIRSIVLVSDGIDTCEEPPACEVARSIAAGEVDLAVQAIGLQVDEDARGQLRCIADVTGGEYTDVSSLGGLVRALRRYQPQGEEVVGGVSPGEATALEPGRWLDRAEPGSQRWYSVALGEGGSLSLDVTIVAPSEDEAGQPIPEDPDAVAALRVVRGGVVGQVACVDEVARGLGPDPVTLSGGTGTFVTGDAPGTAPPDGASPTEEPDPLAGDGTAICAEPGGDVLVGIELSESDVLRDVPLAVELGVDVAGDAAAAPAPEPSPSPSPPPAPAPRPAEPVVQPASDTPQVVLLGLVFATPGALAGAALARRRG